MNTFYDGECWTCYAKNNPTDALVTGHNKTEELFSRVLDRCFDGHRFHVARDRTQPHLGGMRDDFRLEFPSNTAIVTFELDGPHHFNDAVFDKEKTAAEIRARDVAKIQANANVGVTVNVRMKSADVWLGIRRPSASCVLPDRFDWVAAMMTVIENRGCFGCDVLLVEKEGDSAYDALKNELDEVGLLWLSVDPASMEIWPCEKKCKSPPNARHIVWDADNSQTTITNFFNT